MTEYELTPSPNGCDCIGNGLNPDVECQCDECPHYQYTDYLDGVNYDSQNQIATFGNDMFKEFCKFCIQESAVYDVVNESNQCVVCHVAESVIDCFVKCMQSEKNETIRMLCMCSKEMLTMRLNGEHFEQSAEQWIERVGISLINEALKRYDDPEFAVEREMMDKLK